MSGLQAKIQDFIKTYQVTESNDNLIDLYQALQPERIHTLKLVNYVGSFVIKINDQKFELEMDDDKASFSYGYGEYSLEGIIAYYLPAMINLVKITILQRDHHYDLNSYDYTCYQVAPESLVDLRLSFWGIDLSIPVEFLTAIKSLTVDNLYLIDNDFFETLESSDGLVLETLKINNYVRYDSVGLRVFFDKVHVHNLVTDEITIEADVENLTELVETAFSPEDQVAIFQEVDYKLEIIKNDFWHDLSQKFIDDSLEDSKHELLAQLIFHYYQNQMNLSGLTKFASKF